MKAYSSVLIVIGSLILSVTTVFSQQGILDASFGTGGKVVTSVGDSSSVANTVAITQEGKIVVGGYSFVAGQQQATLLMYNTDGMLDTTFGNNGKTIFSDSNESHINSIAIQPDGKIVAAGYSYYSPLLARFAPTGQLDSSFGTNGIASVTLPPDASGGSLSRVIITPDGKILASGNLYLMILDNGTNGIFVTQCLPNGTADSSFGINGVTGIGVYTLGIVQQQITDLTLATDGKILTTVGESAIAYNISNFQIHRLLPDGNRDSTFGESGFIRTDMDSSGDVSWSTVALPDHSFVTAGYSSKFVYHSNTDYYSITSIALAKYLPDGSLDSSFGIAGKVLTLLPDDSTTFINHLLLLPDGRFVVSGYDGKRNDFVVAIYLPNGALDSSFGNYGIITTDFSGTIDRSNSSALQPDGKIVLAGSTSNTINYNIALARYNNDIIYPLLLLSFTAAKHESNNLLQWQVAQEINTSMYEVQRSPDGKNYNAIGYVDAGSNAYSFTDSKPFYGKNYYRLKVIDQNGAFTYSPVRLINNSHFIVVKVYPNPVKGNLRVQIDNSKATVLQWQVISADGKVLLSGQWQVQAGYNSNNINVAALSKGSYYLVVNAGNNEQSAMKFEKL